jgi:hypothetical protein
MGQKNTNRMNTHCFGHYQVGNFTVFSKVEALELSQRTNTPITWHYNDDVFDAQDWTQEPEKNLADFYMDRARQIRDNYDYVVLFYSGGADSHNMLESFIHAGIHIDEIASFHSLAADGDQKSEFNREIFETAIPFVNSLRQQEKLSKDTVHRLIDMSDIVTKFCQDIDWLDFPYMMSSSVSINNVARSNLRRYILDWNNLINQGKRVGLIWGHDKPRIMHENNKFFLNFMDIFDNCVSVSIQQSTPAGWFDEMFYSTPTMPKLVIKQAHIIKNFLEKCDETHPWVTESVTGLGHVVKHRADGTWKTVWLTQDAQSMLIYPWFRPDLYYESKPKDIIYSKRDRWFWQDLTISCQYHKVVDGLISQFGDTWLNEIPEKGLRSTKNFRSKRYWLS